MKFVLLYICNGVAKLLGNDANRDPAIHYSHLGTISEMYLVALETIHKQPSYQMVTEPLGSVNCNLEITKRT